MVPEPDAPAPLADDPPDEDPLDPDEDPPDPDELPADVPPLAPDPALPELPLEPPEPAVPEPLVLDPLPWADEPALTGTTVGVWCVWKVRIPARPAIVPVRTSGARRILFLLGMRGPGAKHSGKTWYGMPRWRPPSAPPRRSQGKRLMVYGVGWNPELFECPTDTLHETGRPAQEHLAVGHVG